MVVTNIVESSQELGDTESVAKKAMLSWVDEVSYVVVKFCKDTLFQDFADYGKQRNRPVVHGWFLGIFLVDGSHMRGFPLRGNATSAQR